VLKQPDNRQEIESRLIAKAWTDADFKQRLLTDPKATLEGELKTKLPAGLKVEVVEESSQRLYLLLPVKPPGAEAHSPEELRALAGGDGLNPFAPSSEAP
jgi:hypothetical protein